MNTIYNVDSRRISEVLSDDIKKVGRLAFLKGGDRLDILAGQLAVYFQRKGGATQEERKSAEHLLEMIRSVETEGQQLQREVSKDAFKELIKIMMR